MKILSFVKWLKRRYIVNYNIRFIKETTVLQFVIQLFLLWTMILPKMTSFENVEKMSKPGSEGEKKSVKTLWLLLVSLTNKIKRLGKMLKSTCHTIKKKKMFHVWYLLEKFNFFSPVTFKEWNCTSKKLPVTLQKL